MVRAGSWLARAARTCWIVDGRRVPVVVAGAPVGRRYLLRLLPDGRLRLTVPRGASVAGGLAFVAAEAAWVAAELERQRVSRDVGLGPS